MDQVPAVTLEEAKRHLKITGNEDDELLAQKLKAAEDHIVAFIGKELACLPVTEEGGQLVMTVPASLKEAVLQQVANFFDGTPAELGGLLAPYRAWAF